MSKTIQDVMTPSPLTVGAQQPVAKAHDMMREHGIRHLPVLQAGGLLGMLSIRDIDLLVSQEGIEAEQLTVEDAMSGSVYEIAPDAALKEVVSHMVANDIGSAVITKGKDVVGVFTATDALKVLASVL